MRTFSINRAERFLVRWANLPDDYTDRDDPEHEAFVDSAFDSLILDFPEFLPPGSESLLAECKRLVRKAWSSTDQRSREWYVFMLRASYNAENGPNPTQYAPPLIDFAMEPPPLTNFEQAMFHFQRKLRAALMCQRSGCPTPYFFRAGRRDKYCSDLCFNLWREEYRQDWWQEKGKVRREEKRSSTGKRRGRPRGRRAK